MTDIDKLLSEAEYQAELLQKRPGETGFANTMRRLAVALESEKERDDLERERDELRAFVEETDAFLRWLYGNCQWSSGEMQKRLRLLGDKVTRLKS